MTACSFENVLKLKPQQYSARSISKIFRRKSWDFLQSIRNQSLFSNRMRTRPALTTVLRRVGEFNTSLIARLKLPKKIDYNHIATTRKETKKNISNLKLGSPTSRVIKKMCQQDRLAGWHHIRHFSDERGVGGGGGGCDKSSYCIPQNSNFRNCLSKKSLLILAYPIKSALAVNHPYFIVDLS